MNDLGATAQDERQNANTWTLTKAEAQTLTINDENQVGQGLL